MNLPEGFPLPPFHHLCFSLWSSSSYLTPPPPLIWNALHAFYPSIFSLFSHFSVSPPTFNTNRFISSSQTWGKSYLKVILGLLRSLEEQMMVLPNMNKCQVINLITCRLRNWLSRTAWWLITNKCDPACSFKICPSFFPPPLNLVLLILF